MRASKETARPDNVGPEDPAHLLPHDLAQVAAFDRRRREPEPPLENGVREDEVVPGIDVGEEAGGGVGDSQTDVPFALGAFHLSLAHQPF
jgi:hypothetical protein